jgi:hypothetical protein
MADCLGRETDRDEPYAWSAREIAQRNRDSAGRPLSPVMKTAATACELARKAAQRDRG